MTRTLLLALLAGCTISSPRFDAPEVVRFSDAATKSAPSDSSAKADQKYLQLGGQEGEPILGGQEGEPLLGGQEGEPVLGGQEGEPVSGAGREHEPAAPPSLPDDPSLEPNTPTIDSDADTNDDIDLGTFNGETDPTSTDTGDTGDVD